MLFIIANLFLTKSPSFNFQSASFMRSVIRIYRTPSSRLDPDQCLCLNVSRSAVAFLPLSCCSFACTTVPAWQQPDVDRRELRDRLQARKSPPASGLCFSFQTRLDSNCTGCFTSKRSPSCVNALQIYLTVQSHFPRPLVHKRAGEL